MPTDHLVQQGESLPAIALHYGLFWETIWNDPANALLKQLRRSPDVLMPGDHVIVPDKRKKEADAATGLRHRFRRKGVPAKTRIQLFDQERPCGEVAYDLDVDGVVRSGKTSSSGLFEEWIAPDARKGKLTVHFEGGDREFDLDFGYLNPATEISGIKQRLNNLGYACGTPDAVADERLEAALRRFQERMGLDATGRVDDRTRDALVRLHDTPEVFPEGQSMKEGS